MRARTLVVGACVVAGACGRLEFDDLRAADAPVTDTPASDAPVDTPPPQPPQFVQHTAAFGSDTTGSATFDNDVVAGNFLIVGFDYGQASDDPETGVTDSLGDTFSVLGPYDTNGARQYVAYGFASASAPDTVTVTLSASADSFFEVRIHEYTNVSPTAPFDVAAGAAGADTSVDGAQTPLVTTSSPNELIFGMVIDDHVTAGTGFTLRGSDFDDCTEDRIAVTPGAYRVTATATGGWTATVAAFRGR